MKFKKITVKCSSETSETIAYFLHEAGSIGEVFDDYNVVKNVLDDKRWDYADATLFEPTDGCSVSGFFTLEDDISQVIARINGLKGESWADFSAIGISTETIDSAEWENEWKKYYNPFHIGNIVIIPEWIKYNPSLGDIPVYLNPGPAFGTGTHETTSMCIRLMQKLDMSGKRVLDFGCGSGILGICANALGASEVLYVDFDDQAISATAHNCALNNITSPELLQCDVREINRPTDIIVANITADVLTDVEPLIASALKAGGYAIISGIINDRADRIEKCYSNRFSLVEHTQQNEWNAYIWKLKR